MSAVVRVAAIVLVASTVAGCGSQSTGTSPFAVAPGPTPTVYAGSIQDSISGAGALRLTLSSAAGVIGGTWAATFNGRSQPVLTFTGTLANDVLTGTVSPEVTDTSGSSGCTLSMRATVSGPGISGTYSTFAVTPTCPAAAAGGFTVTRQ